MHLDACGFEQTRRVAVAPAEELRRRSIALAGECKMDSDQQSQSVTLDPIHDKCARILAARHYRIRHEPGSEPPSWDEIFQVARREEGSYFGCDTPEPTWDEIGKACHRWSTRRHPWLHRLALASAL